jgi:Transposase IS66 family
VHVACTDYLTCMHTGGRSAADIDAGDVLPGYAGTIVRDGYAGYEHLADALHAWCGAHNLRDLPDLYTFDPDGQVCGRSNPDWPHRSPFMWLHMQWRWGWSSSLIWPRLCGAG